MPTGSYFVKSNTAYGSYKYSVPTGFAKYQRASSVGPPSSTYTNSSHYWTPPSTYNAYKRPPYSPSSSDSTRSNGTSYSSSINGSSNGNGGALSRSSYSRASMPRELPPRGYRAFSREPSPTPRYWRTERSAVDTSVPSTTASDYRTSSSSMQNRSEISRVDSVRSSRRDRFER